MMMKVRLAGRVGQRLVAEVAARIIEQVFKQIAFLVGGAFSIASASFLISSEKVAENNRLWRAVGKSAVYCYFVLIFTLFVGLLL